MKKIKSLSDNVDIENKRIILRSDFNVPIINKLIQDNTRIDICIPFIKKLLNRNAKIFLVSHLGRPKNDNDKNLTLKPVFEYLKKKYEIIFFFMKKKLTKIQKEKYLLKKRRDIAF